jgi:hypothetical protein
MGGLMVAEGSSLSMSGSKFSTTAFAISTAASAYIIVSAIVTSTNKVMGAGAGTFTGRVSGLSSSTMTNLMNLQATALGLSGKDLYKLFFAVSFGVVMAMNSVMAQGTVIGGGPGTGTGRIIGLVPLILQPIIMAQLSAVSIMGQKTALIALAMAMGICMHIMISGYITTICIGSFTPPPVGPVILPAAPGFGRLI